MRRFTAPQQLVKSPFVLLDIDGRFDVIARIMAAASPAAGALRLGVSRALNEIDRDANRPGPQEGWLPDLATPAPPSVRRRPQEGPSFAVLSAILFSIMVVPCLSAGRDSSPRQPCPG